MIFLANRANLDARTLLTRIHTRFQTQVSDDDSPVEQVWYRTSTGNKTGVSATISPDEFCRSPYPGEDAELQVSFDFPQTHSHDFYAIQWVESDRDLMIGWHQDDTHVDLGECHFQLDYQGETVRRAKAEYLDMHPLNVLDRRLEDLVDVLDALTWTDGIPSITTDAIK
jgi:hypothetical protein